MSPRTTTNGRMECKQREIAQTFRRRFLARFTVKAADSFTEFDIGRWQKSLEVLRFVGVDGTNGKPRHSAGADLTTTALAKQHEPFSSSAQSAKL